MNLLITGGAGYIGAHVAQAFLDKGAEVTVLDDLSNSYTKRVEALNVNFVKGSILNSDLLSQLLKNKEMVIHCAAFKSVAESEINPEKYEKINYLGTKSLIQEMLNSSVNQIIFASTAAVYGNSVTSPIVENCNPVPISVYGKTKLMAEELITNYCKSSGLKATSLRYFNAVGAYSRALVDTSTDNLFPKVFSSIASGMPPEIFGDDYPTEDGTCVRDFIHVLDIAEAHLAVAEYLKRNEGHAIFNVGTGKGYSVRKVIEGIQRIAGTKFDPIVKPRRSGDLDKAFANPKLIEEKTGWKARFELEDMIKSAWNAWSGK